MAKPKKKKKAEKAKATAQAKATAPTKKKKPVVVDRNISEVMVDCAVPELGTIKVKAFDVTYAPAEGQSETRRFAKRVDARAWLRLQKETAKGGNKLTRLTAAMERAAKGISAARKLDDVLSEAQDSKLANIATQLDDMLSEFKSDDEEEAAA
jgi:hypothetical protein